MIFPWFSYDLAITQGEVRLGGGESPARSVKIGIDATYIAAVIELQDEGGVNNTVVQMFNLTAERVCVGVCVCVCLRVYLRVVGGVVPSRLLNAGPADLVDRGHFWVAFNCRLSRTRR